MNTLSQFQVDSEIHYLDPDIEFWERFNEMIEADRRQRLDRLQQQKRGPKMLLVAVPLVAFSLIWFYGAYSAMNLLLRWMR